MLQYEVKRMVLKGRWSERGSKPVFSKTQARKRRSNTRARLKRLCACDIVLEIYCHEESSFEISCNSAFPLCVGRFVPLEACSWSIVAFSFTQTGVCVRSERVRERESGGGRDDTYDWYYSIRISICVCRCTLSKPRLCDYFPPLESRPPLCNTGRPRCVNIYIALRNLLTAARNNVLQLDTDFASLSDALTDSNICHALG